jgi:hypothetical protein
MDRVGGMDLLEGERPAGAQKAPEVFLDRRDHPVEDSGLTVITVRFLFNLGPDSIFSLSLHALGRSRPAPSVGKTEEPVQERMSIPGVNFRVGRRHEVGASLYPKRWVLTHPEA